MVRYQTEKPEVIAALKGSGMEKDSQQKRKSYLGYKETNTYGHHDRPGYVEG